MMWLYDYMTRMSAINLPELSIHFPCFLADSSICFHMFPLIFPDVSIVFHECSIDFPNFFHIFTLISHIFSICLPYFPIFFHIFTWFSHMFPHFSIFSMNFPRFFRTNEDSAGPGAAFLAASVVMVEIRSNGAKACGPRAVPSCAKLPGIHVIYIYIMCIIYIYMFIYVYMYIYICVYVYIYMIT